jgi:hypothetical protein
MLQPRTVRLNRIQKLNCYLIEKLDTGNDLHVGTKQLTQPCLVLSQSANEQRGNCDVTQTDAHDTCDASAKGSS